MSSNETFSAVLARLRDTSKPVPMASLYHLSDLSKDDRTALEAVWQDMSTERRQAIVQDLQEIAEANFEVSFDEVFKLALEDESAETRAVAIRALWESEDPALMAPFIDYMLHDPDPVVRAAAASALGRYVYLGELEELPAAQVKRVEAVLLDAIHGDDELEVRRRALEAIAFSSRPDLSALITEAYASDEIKLRVSAVFAMGRTGDNQWEPQVREELESSEPEMRFEAVRAAGEMELTDLAAVLAELATDEDPQVSEAAIWSLGQVGGDVAREALTELLEQAEDDDMRDFIDEAIENLEFTNEVAEFSLLEFGPDDDDPLDLEDELSDDGDEDEPA
jgi:HEAT repeat protein